MSDKPPIRRRSRARLEPPALGAIDPTLGIPIGQQIYRTLRRALIAGRIGAGDRLSIRAIAESLGVSPAPVRDALKQLEAGEVLEARRKSAFFPSPVGPDLYDQLERVRVELEGFAAGEAARRADARDVRMIEDAADRYLDAVHSNPADTVAANHSFHFAIYHASRNAVLVQLIENLWLRMGPLLATRLARL
ncbi:MAG: GntR family transcriptional regulator [Sphingomonas sp.]